MPEDGIPYWDFGAPGEERDSSAGSIMASGLLELSNYVGAEKEGTQTSPNDCFRAVKVKHMV